MGVIFAEFCLTVEGLGIKVKAPSSRSKGQIVDGAEACNRADAC